MNVNNYVKRIINESESSDLIGKMKVEPELFYLLPQHITDTEISFGFAVSDLGDYELDMLKDAGSVDVYKEIDYSNSSNVLCVVHETLFYKNAAAAVAEFDEFLEEYRASWEEAYPEEMGKYNAIKDENPAEALEILEDLREEYGETEIGTFVFLVKQGTVLATEVIEAFGYPENEDTISGDVVTGPATTMPEILPLTAATEENEDDLDTKFYNIFHELVPGEGNCESVAGELIRAVAKLRYRFWNDGDRVGIGYGNETCNYAARYLQKHSFGKVSELANRLFDTHIPESEYEALIKELTQASLDFIEENPGLKEQANTEDYADYYDPKQDRDDDDDYYEDEEEDYYDESASDDTANEDLDSTGKLSVQNSIVDLEDIKETVEYAHHALNYMEDSADAEAVKKLNACIKAMVASAKQVDALLDSLEIRNDVTEAATALVKKYTLVLACGDKKVTITTTASSREQAIKQVCDSEHAPESAVLTCTEETL